MFSGWVHYLQLTAKAKTGLSTAVVVFALIAAIAAAAAFVLLRVRRLHLACRALQRR